MTYSIIQKSQLEGATRLDAEYYQPEYLDLDQKIKSGNYSRFGNFISILTDYTANGSFAGLKHNVHVYDEIGFAKWIRIQNLDNEDFENNIRYVNKDSFNFLKKSALSGGELLISKTGEYLGRAYLMPKLLEKTTLADNIFLIHLKNKSLKEFIITFINSSIGRKLLLRRLQGTGQPTIIKESLRDYLIPIPTEEFNQIIKVSYSEYKKELENSKLFYQQAENLLLEELGLKNFESEGGLFSIINLSEVKSANRIDAEYFQEKYERLIKKIKQNNVQKLGDIVSIKKGIEVGAEEYQEDGKIFIRVSSMTKFGIVENDQKYLSDKLYERLKDGFEPKKEEILLTKDATPGIAYVLKENIQGIISGGTLRLKLKNTGVESEYLAFCLNSIIGQMQAERDAGGSVIAHWKPEQIKNILIPILPKPTQQKIADLIQKSHNARKKAKELLEEAKHRVEEIIEK